MSSHPRSARRAFLGALWAAAIAGSPFAVAAPDRLADQGAVRTQTRRLEPFTGVALALPAQVEVRTGQTPGVTIEAEDKLLPLIETRVENGALHIRAAKGAPAFNAAVVKIVVVAPRIDNLAVAGSGTMSAASLQAPRLNLQVAGSGALVLREVRCESMQASIAGDGRIELDGAALRLSASVAGAGTLAAERLKTQTAAVSVMGAGEAALWVTGTLDASIAGAGQVRYAGNPKVHAAVVGSGSAARVAGAPS